MTHGHTDAISIIAPTARGTDTTAAIGVSPVIAPSTATTAEAHAIAAARLDEESIMFRMSNLSWSEDAKPKAAERHTPTFANYRETLSPESCTPRTLEDDDAFMQLLRTIERQADAFSRYAEDCRESARSARRSARTSLAIAVLSLLITLLSLLQQFGVLQAFAVFLAGLL